MKADSFSQPLPSFAGTYPNSWAGYVHLQPRTPEGLSYLRHIGDDYNGAGGGNTDLGQNVVSIANGIVETVIPWNGNYGYGKHIFVRHELTNALRAKIKLDYKIDTQILYSHYAHLNDYVVRTGQEVTKGQVIAHLGKTGTTLAHLHVEIRKPTGQGYEDYPSERPVTWVNQYYFTPFTFIARYKNPLTDISPIPVDKIMQIRMVLNSNDPDPDKLYKIRQIVG